MQKKLWFSKKYLSLEKFKFLRNNHQKFEFNKEFMNERKLKDRRMSLELNKRLQTRPDSTLLHAKNGKKNIT